MDWDGPWSPDLISLYLPVAVETQLKMEQSFGRALISAVSSFSDAHAWKDYIASLEEALQSVRDDQLSQRGVTAEDRHALAADQLVEAFTKIAKMKGLKR